MGEKLSIGALAMWKEVPCLRWATQAKHLEFRKGDLSKCHTGLCLQEKRAQLVQISILICFPATTMDQQNSPHSGEGF